MMHDFLTLHRGELIECCRAKVAQRSSPEPTPDELRHGIPMFLDQLIKTLRVEQTSEPMESRKVSGPASGVPSLSEIDEGATMHGRELHERGFTVQQVVHDYGDLCQAITDLAFECEAPFDVDEFRTLNRCLDNAIAGAVGAFVHQRDYVAAEHETQTLNQPARLLCPRAS